MQVVVNGIITNYLFYKGPSTKTLVILPGWKNPASLWSNISEQLSQKYNVLVLDFPGFGYTSKPPKDWDTYEYAEFTKHFLQKLGVSDYILLGHSFGGRVAIILASDKTASVRKLILVNSAGIKTKSILSIISSFLAREFRFSKAFLSKLGLNLELISNLARSGDYRDAQDLRGSFARIVDQNLTRHLSDIKIPTLIVWGDQDKELKIDTAKILHQKILDSKIRIVWGAGHHPHIEKPHQFMEILEQWLK